MKRIVLFIVCIFLLPAFFAEGSTKEKNVQLIKAAEKGKLENIQDALNDGADVNAKDTFGWTVLMRASYGGYTRGRYAEVVKLILDKGANVNINTDEGITALMAASSGGYSKKDIFGKALTASESVCIEVVKLLLVKGADINVKNRKGETALMIAKDKGYKEIVGMLEKAGAKE